MQQYSVPSRLIYFNKKRSLLRCVNINIYLSVVISFHLPESVSIWSSVCFMVKISEKPEDKSTSGTNRVSKDSSSEYDDLWIDPGQVLRLFVRETYISSFPFLEIWIWPSTSHWERVLFMLCQKLQHASRSLLVVLTLFVIMLCFVWRKPQCVLFVMGARGRGRCVFNYHLVEWLMVRQSSTELQLSVCVRVCVCVFSSMCDFVCMCGSLHVQTASCMFACACLHLCFFMRLVPFPYSAFIQRCWVSSAATATDVIQQNKFRDCSSRNTNQKKKRPTLRIITFIYQIPKWSFRDPPANQLWSDVRPKPGDGYGTRTHNKSSSHGNAVSLIRRDCPHKTWPGLTRHPTACLDNLSVLQSSIKQQLWRNPDSYRLNKSQSRQVQSLYLSELFWRSCPLYPSECDAVFLLSASVLHVPYLWRWRVFPSVAVSRCITEPWSLLLTEMSRTQMEPMND